MNRDYSPEVKAAVMAALLEGQSVRTVAAQYNVSKSTVGVWAKESKGVHIVQDSEKKEIGDLLVEYIRASLASMKTQVEHFGDKTWLTSQEADALAVLHGVQTDKAIKLLEAITREAEPE